MNLNQLKEDLVSSRGEFYITNKAIYEVVQVTHSYRSSSEAGVIQVKKVRDLKTAG